MNHKEFDFTKKELVSKKVDGYADSWLPAGRKWELVWADEFDGDKLDEEKWGFRLNFWGKPAVQFTDKGVSLDGKGNLHIKPVRLEDGRICSAQLQTASLTYDMPKKKSEEINVTGSGDNFEWPFGDIEKPKFMHRYGYYEVRCKLQNDKSRCWWSAFWLQSPNTGSAPKAEYCGVECDIMEYFSDDILTCGCFYDGYSKTSLKVAGRVHFDVPAPDAEGYHRFGLLWDKDKYVYYCDGVEISRVTFPVSQVEQFILLSTEVQGYRRGDGKHYKEGAESILGDEFVVDYVRVFDEKED